MCLVGLGADVFLLHGLCCHAKGELTMKHRVVWIVTFVVLVVLFTVSVAMSAGNGFEVRSSCRVEGAWVSSFTGPWDKALIMQETLTPLDPAGKKLAYVMHLVNPDATFGIPVPPFSEN